MTDFENAHVLLVDDDRNLVTTIGDYLEMAKFEVTRAHSGEEALRLVEKKKPDIVVLDVGVPGIGGLGFLKEVEAPDGRPRMPVLMLTAKAAMEDFFKSVAADGFLAKPCTGPELVTEIRAILRRRSGEPAPIAYPGTRVLLVEDHPVVSRKLSSMFRDAGLEVDVVETAFEIFKGSIPRPDVIVSKEVLEGMKGSSAAMMAQGHAATKGIPFVLYDASGRIERRLFQGDQQPAAVDSLVLTNEAEAVLEAVNGVLQALQT